MPRQRCSSTDESHANDDARNRRSSYEKHEVACNSGENETLFDKPLDPKA